jgi:hypothetical protein
MVQAGRRAAEVQELYLSGTRRKSRYSAPACGDDVIPKTGSGKFYPLAFINGGNAVRCRCPVQFRLDVAPLSRKAHFSARPVQHV